MPSPAIAASLQLYSGQALVHTSGALPASVLAPAMAAGTGAGGFHPLVAFADHDQALVDLAGATVAVEGDATVLPLLAELAESIGARPVTLPAGGKIAYHAAAMMAAGGLIGLLDAIASVARLAGLDERTAVAVYAPLARQALANAERMGIDEALTGPLLRGDVGTLRGHLGALAEHAPDAVPLYVEVARREVAIARRRGELADDLAEEIERLLAEANTRPGSGSVETESLGTRGRVRAMRKWRFTTWLLVWAGAFWTVTLFFLLRGMQGWDLGHSVGFMAPAFAIGLWALGTAVTLGGYRLGQST